MDTVRTSSRVSRVTLVAVCKTRGPLRFERPATGGLWVHGLWPVRYGPRGGVLRRPRLVYVPLFGWAPPR